ncbi:protein phosphatase 2C domain-containing protein [Dactylosporangium sp. CS-047395]|uniref:protein phosphatase 2C domain-containing protein n=1 Tax=Dactylosporangium sp. CS-047395 TaxID=3239936 RepID=UPI003D8DC11A
MELEIAVLHVPKRGSSEAEYEDAWHAEPPSGDVARLAVADGASEAMLAGRWAAELVGEFTDDVASTAVRAAARWDAVVAEYVADREQREKPIRWYEEPGLERGAYATLLGVQVRADGTFAASAVGDSCLFQVRAGRLLLVFPIDDPAGFGSAPDLLPSRRLDAEKVTAVQRQVSGGWESGDVFHLATDAVAHWILAHGGPDGAAALTEGDIEGLRERGALRDDDVTLITAVVTQ